MWLYDYNFLSGKGKQNGNLVWEKDGYVLLKINCIWTKAQLREIKFIKDWLKALQSIHSPTLKNLHLGEPRAAESCKSHAQHSRNSLRLLGASGVLVLRSWLCNQPGLLVSFIKPNPWFTCSRWALWLHFISLPLFFPTLLIFLIFPYPSLIYFSLPFSNLFYLCHITFMYADLNPF